VNDARPPPDLGELPEARSAPKSRWSFQLVWLIPLLALAIGGWLAVQAIRDRGPTITISFKTGEGLEAGKTKLRYKDLEVGLVKTVTLAPDLSGVIATAELVKGAEKYLVEDTRFWVVKPRISGGSVSGLGTLLSGSYIGVDIGKSHSRRKQYVGLERPPAVTIDVPGRQFALQAESIGSLDVGSPIYYRRLQVGQVTDYELDAAGKGIDLKIFINSPYERYVNSNTRFWHASGIDVALDAGGVRIKTESLVALAIGGIAFETPATAEALPPADAGRLFRLAADQADANKRQDTIVDNYVMVFSQSVRGLVVGAPIEFLGIPVGEVSAINTDFNPKTGEFSIPVEMRLFPERFSSRTRAQGAGGRVSSDPKVMLGQMVAKGFRAQLRTGNLVTGAVYVALDFFPDAEKVTFDPNKSPLEVPTTESTLEDLQETLANIANSLEKVQFDKIGEALRQTLEDVNKLITRLDREVAPELRGVLADGRTTLAQMRKTLDDASRTIATAERAVSPDADLTQDLRETVREVARAAQTMRALADYLERHPEALLRGKAVDPK
jgi:paraquat-inducible protein B